MQRDRALGRLRGTHTLGKGPAAEQTCRMWDVS